MSDLNNYSRKRFGSDDRYLGMEGRKQPWYDSEQNILSNTSFLFRVCAECSARKIGFNNPKKITMNRRKTLVNYIKLNVIYRTSLKNRITPYCNVAISIGM